jgi:hypothetical protein
MESMFGIGYLSGVELSIIDHNPPFCVSTGVGFLGEDPNWGVPSAV